MRHKKFMNKFVTYIHAASIFLLFPKPMLPHAEMMKITPHAVINSCNPPRPENNLIPIMKFNLGIVHE